MKTKDFSMLLEKVSTSSSKKDIGYVDEANSFVAQIENLFKTHKGENVSDIYFGIDLVSDPQEIQTNKRGITSTLAYAIKYGIKNVFNPRVTLLYSSETLLKFKVDFSYEIGPEKFTPTSCIIEIPLS